MATIYSVKIHYGPCNTFYCSTHKPGRLTGLRADIRRSRTNFNLIADRLQTMGYRVQLIPEKFENYCMIEMCGHEIFRCKLGNLMFNTSCELDPVCQRAVAAILDASRKFIRARCHLWVNTIIKRRISYIGSKHLIDHWAQKYDMDSFAPVFRCNLKNLMYNTPFYMDPVCLRAVEAVQEARIKLMRARIHLWVTTLSRKAHFANEKLQLKNHWPEKLNLPSLAPLSTCLDCCGICSTKKK